MSERSYFIPTAAFLTILIGLGVLDAFLTIDVHPWQTLQANVQNEPNAIENHSDKPNTANTSSSPAQRTGMSKKRSPNVPEVLTAQGFVTQEANEPLFLPQVITDQNILIQTGILLKDGDRAGVIAWTETQNVKLYFRALKEALHSYFTPAISDLIDETQRIPGLPPRNFLTFLDPGISEERIVFIRIRDRLYEAHIAKGKEEVMFGLLDALSGK